MRLTPYKLGSTLLLDVQHVIPLPEASSYTVRVREKEIAVKRASESAADRQSRQESRVLAPRGSHSGRRNDLDPQQ